MYDLETNNDDELENDGQDDVVDYPNNDESDVSEFDNMKDVDTEDLEGEEVEDEKDENEGVIAPEESTKQSPAENAQYKKMRLKAEKEAKLKYESEYTAEREELSAIRLDLEQKQNEKRITDEFLSPNAIYEFADKEGMSEEQAERMLKLQAQSKIDSEKVQVAENFNRVQEQKQSLKKDKYYNLLEKDVNEIIKQHPTADYRQVYAHLRFEKADELEKQLASNVEKRTTANIHDRSKRRNVGGSQGASSTGSNMSDFGKEFASFMGVDSDEASKIVKERGRKRK